MVFNVHFSFNAKKVNISQTQNDLIDIANKYNANNFYFLYEEKFIKNKLQIFCIFDVIFELNELNNMLLCIKNVRNMSKIYLDCIFEENNIFKLIYASKEYLTSLEKNSLSNYNKFHRERSYSDTDAIILSAVFKKYGNSSSRNDIKAPFSYDEYLKRIN